jgi:hypothetical protein
VRPHAALVGPVPPPCAHRLAHVRGLPRAEGGVERGVARAELAAAVAPAPLLHAAHGDGHLRVGRHQHGGIEDAVLLGADQLLAVQQQERPVGPVRHLEERDAAGLAHLGDAGAISFAPHPTLSPAGRGWDEVLQREPVGVVEVGGEERDDGEGAVGHGLAGAGWWRGAWRPRGLRSAWAWGGSSFGVVEDPACIRSVTGRVPGADASGCSVLTCVHVSCTVLSFNLRICSRNVNIRNS